MRRIRAGAIVLALGGAGCSAAAAELAQPPSYDPVDQTKCRVQKSMLRPLIIEWPAADRTALEVRQRDGVTVVRYDGCEMEVLASCRGRADYEYVGVTPKLESVAIRDADELYAAIPIHAASFEGRLARSGRLDVNMTVVGVYQTTSLPTAAELEGDCAKATHVIRSFTVGAFEFSSGGAAELGAGAELGGFRAGGKSSAKRELLSRDGDTARCATASADAQAPPFGCGAFLRLEVAPLARPAATADHSPSAPPKSESPSRPPLLEVLRE